MQGTFIGFNTASIKYEDKFLALMLKVKLSNQLCQSYYLQAQALTDLLLVLQHRMAIVLQRLNAEGESYKSELVAFNEQLIENTPVIDMPEVQQPNPERRVISITLKPGATWSTLILVLQNEQIATLRIDDMQVEALLVGIQQSLKNAGDNELIKNLTSSLESLMLYALELTNSKNVDYQQYIQDEWKLNLFSHYLGVLYCCDTEAGRKIISGAVIKTNAAHPSEQENSVVMRLIEKSPKLKEVHAQHQPCQIFSQIIPSQPGRMLSLEECLRPLHAFYLATQAKINAR